VNIMRKMIQLIVLMLIVNAAQAEDSIQTYTGTIVFEVALGISRCRKNNLDISEQAVKIVNRGMTSGIVNIKYKYKHLSVVTGFYGPYEYSTNIAPDSDKTEGDIIIEKDSELKFGNYGVGTTWDINAPFGFEFQPSVGYRSYYIDSDIQATSNTTGDKLSAKGDSRSKGVQIGLTITKAIWTKRKEQQISKQWGIQFPYAYQLSDNRISDYGVRTTFSFIQQKGIYNRSCNIFIEYKKNEGILFDQRYLSVGMNYETSPGVFFTR